jgi:hypothetical protein
MHRKGVGANGKPRIEHNSPECEPIPHSQYTVRLSPLQNYAYRIFQKYVFDIENKLCILCFMCITISSICNTLKTILYSIYI